SFLNDAGHWRDRAEEARTRADQIGDPQSKNAMLRIAHDCELLAERAEARASGNSPKSNWPPGRRHLTPPRLGGATNGGGVLVLGRVAVPAFGDRSGRKRRQRLLSGAKHELGARI